MNKAAYLERIQHPIPLQRDVETLRTLQRAHLLHVPFENLDIGLKRPIRIDEESIWAKLIERKRGGFCYELNGLFAWLLKELGYTVTYLNARDYHEADDTFGIEFDHLTLLIRVPDDSTRWLVDVGWGDSFTVPLDIDNSDWQADGLRAYRIEPFRAGYQLWQRGYRGRVERQYYFDLVPHQFPAEYEAACRYHQTSPESIFTRNRIISRLTEQGRVSLDNDRLIITTDGNRQVHAINEDEYARLLKENYDIEL